MMPDAEREIAKREAIGISDEAKDHSELAVGWRQIDLEAGGQPRPIAAFGIKAAQDLDLDTFLRELPPGLSQRLGARAAASHRVLSERALVEENAGIAPPDGQGLPLAVCGLKRPVLSLEGCDLLLGGITLVLAEHCLPRGIASDHELACAALLNDDELALESAADLDVRRLR